MRTMLKPPFLALLLAASACSPPARDSSGGGGNGGGGNGGAGGGLGKGKPFSGDESDPSAPAGAKDAFGGPASSDAGAKPVLVYPLDGVMLGKNILGMNIQWKAGTGNTIYRVRIKGDAGEAHVYAGAGACPSDKCQLPVSDALWLKIATANADAGITIGVDAVASPGGAVASSDPIGGAFTAEDIKGGLYYFSTKLPGTMRVAFGDNKPEPWITPKSTQNPYACEGCHAITHDGCRIALTYEGGDGHLGIVDAKDNSKLYLDPMKEQSNFQSWNPDGDKLMTVRDGVLKLRDNVGTLIKAVDASLVGDAGNTHATHPEWSPDGHWLAFTRLNKGATRLNDWMMSGDIMLMDATDAKFDTAATILVPQAADEYHYYPHFSPDSKWVVFNTGKVPGKSPGMETLPNFSPYDQTSSRLRLVAVAGGTPIELGNATHAENMSASWPKFSPFSQKGGSMFFIVFSSRVDYGWVVEQSTIMPQPPGLYGRPQLWVAAIDVNRKGDPSYAPFWLPFQGSSDGNHLGYWTTRIAGGTIMGSDCK